MDNVEVIEAPSVELTQQQQYARNLRALADWYEQHPNAPLDSASVSKVNYHFKASPEEIRAIGAGEKVFEGPMFYYTVTTEFFTLQWAEMREKICTPRVVGKKIVPSFYQPEREEDVVEWDCPGSLLNPAEEVSDDSR